MVVPATRYNLEKQACRTEYLRNVHTVSWPLLVLVFSPALGVRAWVSGGILPSHMILSHGLDFALSIWTTLRAIPGNKLFGTKT